MGLVYRQLNLNEKAEKEFIEVTSLNPGSTQAHYYLALTYLSLDKRDKAYDEYRIINAIDNKLSDKILNLIYK
jgi:Tfp pilus assembly protein PilF